VYGSLASIIFSSIGEGSYRGVRFHNFQSSLRLTLLSLLGKSIIDITPDRLDFDTIMVLLVFNLRSSKSVDLRRNLHFHRSSQSRYLLIGPFRRKIFFLNKAPLLVPPLMRTQGILFKTIIFSPHNCNCLYVLGRLITLWY